MSAPLVTDIRFYPARANMVDTGLLGWTSFCLAGVQFHDVGMRRTKAGAFALSWPRTRSAKGGGRCAVHPKDDASRAALEAQILAEAKRQGVLP